MTLVYDKGPLPNGPVTHAFVLGCGRFPHNAALDRIATVAGARSVMKLLAAHGHEFVAPVWRIRCLLSESGVAPGSDVLGVELHDPGGGAQVTGTNGSVDSVLLAFVETEGDAWLNDMRPGDSAFFYMSSHGIAVPGNALGLCEDVLSSQRRKWSASLNVTTLAGGLGTMPLERAWVFFDACQEIVSSLLGAPTGVPGLKLIDYSATDQASAKSAVALAGSKFGSEAWAPDDGNPPYFTQALIEGLENACVEPVQDLGWTITAERLMFGLPILGRIMGIKVQCTPLTSFNEPGVGLRTVQQPQIPFAITTEVEEHLSEADVDVTCDDVAVPPMQRARGQPGSAWRFRVEAHRKRSFTATARFQTAEPAYKPYEFYAVRPEFVKLGKAT